MPFAALLIGAVIIVAALAGTHRELAAELEADLPGFFKWGVAIVVILGLGFIPGLRTPSRLLLALVIVVLVLTQYKAIIGGIQSFAQGSGQPSSGTAPASDGAAIPVSVPPGSSPVSSLLFSPADFLAAFTEAVA